MPDQLSIDGIAHPLHQVMKEARMTMRMVPLTYKSHFQLMRTILKRQNFKFMKYIDPEELYKLERLLELSPDFERCARKIREEDELAQKGIKKERRLSIDI